MIALVFVLCTSICLADQSIQYAAVVFRHGDRTPVDLAPYDPYNNESLWPVKFGQLTNTGKEQHYQFGKWLRERYSHLLSDGFDPAEISISSTDVDRTLMSALANAAGLYPAKGKNIWDNNLMWQPIPVHTVPEKDDEVIAMKKTCPVYNRELNRVRHSKEYIDGLSQYKYLMNYLAEKTGKPVKDYYDIEDIYSNLYIESLYNFTLPAWTHAVYPDSMQTPACHSFATSAATPLLARLRAGPIISQITEDMERSVHLKDSGVEPFKVKLYSGHDFTIGTILTALNIFDGKCPTYTSAIFFELINDGSLEEGQVRISYRNFTGTGEPHVLKIPNCGFCSLRQFTEVNLNLMSVNFDVECNLNDFDLISAHELHITVSIVLVLVAIMYAAHKIKTVGRIYQV